MASLYNRATPSQVRILRIVEGAIKNAADAHPELDIRPHHRRSIAKRAAGTLTAQWPEVLAAASRAPESGVGLTVSRPHRQSSHRMKAVGRGAAEGYQRFPLRRLIAEIARPIRDLKLSGQTERARAFVDVLRTIHRLRFPTGTEPQDAARSASALSATDEK
jgi:hypothetical protein